MRKFLLSVSVGMLLGLAAFVVADTTTTVTNRGQVIIVKTLDNVATDAKDLTVYQDFSRQATVPGDIGSIVRYYDFTTQGGAVGAHQMLPAIALPDNAVIEGGFIKVLTAVTPTNSVKSIFVASAADLYAAATNSFVSTGFLSVVPAYTGATAIQTTTATNYVTFNIATEAVTAGKVMVVLRYTLAP